MKFRENRGDNQDILQIINSLLASGDLCPLLITYANNLIPDLSVLIWIQTVCHSDSVPERIF